MVGITGNPLKKLCDDSTKGFLFCDMAEVSTADMLDSVRKLAKTEGVVAYLLRIPATFLWRLTS